MIALPTSLARFRRGLIRLLLALVPMLTVAPQRGGAADPLAYTVTIAPTGEAEMDTALGDAATLVALRESAPVGAFALLSRARGDAGRLATVLHSFGYYQGRVAITIAGRPLDDPGLADALEAMPDKAEVPVAVAITPGKLFHLRRIALTGDVPPGMRGSLGLAEGAPARAADVLAARDRLLAALRADSYALATADPPQATLDEATGSLDVVFPVQAGPRVDLGDISISGLQRLNESYVRRRLPLQPGERYDPARIEAARQELADTPALAAVRIDTAGSLDAQGRLPVRVDVTERKLRAVNLSAAWSTDQGGRLSASWTHRNLFGNAEQLTLSAETTGLGGTATRQPGYNLGALLTIPDWQRRDQSLTFRMLGVNEYLQAYDRTAAIGGVAVQRKLSRELTASLGVTGELARIKQEGLTNDYKLLELPAGLTWDSTRNPFDPTGGVKASVALTPIASFGPTGTTAFVIAQASASTYIDFGSKGRTVLALRALVGGMEGASVEDVPPDQRFYAGGGGTVRGYRFQSVGPKFPSGRPTGGTSIDTGTIELRQRFGESWGAVAFVDAGQVGTTGVPFSGNIAVGAGVGARYYTSIGPIRLDVAVPVVRGPKTDTLQVYIGIGQAF
ncbi:autotransporter assembly complex protein TamA [Limobrevibacterium gyesilva]|uniref:autotransporter assembly complex protein TamA n=1 Tax=Limobrevibacterium gyesilva TaxID=2991712 RepID=UPI0022274EDE|nr:autotransporter assembly complex family protein [Limobrevibacterium gyesilva]